MLTSPNWLLCTSILFGTILKYNLNGEIVHKEKKTDLKGYLGSFNLFQNFQLILRLSTGNKIRAVKNCYLWGLFTMRKKDPLNANEILIQMLEFLLQHTWTPYLVV